MVVKMFWFNKRKKMHIYGTFLWLRNIYLGSQVPA